MFSARSAALIALTALVLPACASSNDDAVVSDAPVAEAIECAEGTTAQDGFCVPSTEQAMRPSVRSAEIVAFDAPADAHLLHSLPVAADIALDADPFHASITFALRSGDDVCILGAASVQHQGGEAVVSVSDTFKVTSECADLLGRDDVRVIAALDIEGGLDWAERGGLDDMGTIAQRVADSQLAQAQTCLTCAGAIDLSDSPGLDIKLHSLSLGSSVAVLPLERDNAADAASEGAMPARQGEGAMPTTPHMMVRANIGLDGVTAETLIEQGAHVTYAIRPSADANGFDGLAAESRDWASLERETRDGDVKARITHDPVSRLRGTIATTKTAPVFIGEAVAERMDQGDWKDIYQFDVQVCVETDLDEIVIRDGLTVRNNNCATVPVTVLREYYNTNGTPAVDTSNRQGVANTGTWREVQGYDSTNLEDGDALTSVSAYSEHGYTSGQNATSRNGVTLNGTHGVWHENGLWTGFTIGSYSLSIVKVNSNLHARNGGDKVEVLLNVLTVNKLDVVSNALTHNSTKSMQDLGISSSQTSYSLSYPMFGWSYMPTYGLNISIDLQGSFGLDPGGSTYKYWRNNTDYDDPCSDGVENTVNGESLCFYPSQTSGSVFGALVDSACGDLGYPAPLRDVSDHAAVTSMMAMYSGISNAWIGVNKTGSSAYTNSYSEYLGLSGSSAYTTNINNIQSHFFFLPLSVARGYGIMSSNGTMSYATSTQTATMTTNAVVCARRSDNRDTVLTITSVIEPFVSLGVSAGASVSTLAGGGDWSFGGVSATINALEMEMPMTAYLKVTFPKNGLDPHGYGTLDYDATLEALSGSLDITLGADYASVDIPLFEWDGINLGTWSIYDSTYPVF